jgi:RNA polymerase sigma-70 factor (ECF subfamily)
LKSANRGGDLKDEKLGKEEIHRFYEHHGGALLVYARSFALDHSAAEDAVQLVFLKLLRGETVVPDNPLAYLYRAVRNTALNTQRISAREISLDEESTWFTHRGRNREAELALQKVLRELPEEQREVVLMRIWSGMTLEEVSAATGAPLNTVASRYRYALEKLRERLKPFQKGLRT